MDVFMKPGINQQDDSAAGSPGDKRDRTNQPPVGKYK
jgi:hypothetical protein